TSNIIPAGLYPWNRFFAITHFVHMNKRFDKSERRSRHRRHWRRWRWGRFGCLCRWWVHRRELPKLCQELTRVEGQYSFQNHQFGANFNVRFRGGQWDEGRDLRLRNELAVSLDVADRGIRCFRADGGLSQRA